MKTRQYLKVSYIAAFGPHSQDFLLKESHLITKILKEGTVDNKCDVELMTVSEKEFKIIFG